MKLAWLRSQDAAHDDSLWTTSWVPATDDSPALLLTGSLDETVKLWNPQDLSLIRTNSGHCLGVISVAAHTSGKIAASASMDSFVRVFDVESNNTIATLEALPSEVWQLQFNPQTHIILPEYMMQKDLKPNSEEGMDAQKKNGNVLYILYICCIL